MEYKKFEYPSFNLYTVKTNRFKTCQMEIIFKDEASRENAMLKTFLADIMTDCSEKYASRKEVARTLEELYQASFYGLTNKTGNLMMTSFVLNFLNPKYVNDKDYLDGYRSKYSTVNRYTYSDPEAPTFIITYAQSQFLLAEAAVRGWVSGDAKTYYENGVRAAMEQFAQFPKALSLYAQYLGAGAISAYLDENPFDQSKALEQINTQYWINCFCNTYEAYSNWRRSGYPDLKSPYDPANPYGSSATDGSIPRRFRYPSTESQVNMNNYNDAVSRMNKGDSFMSRVWWDVKQ